MGTESTTRKSGPPAFPVLLRVPRLAPESTLPPLVLPPLPGTGRWRGKAAAAGVLVVALLVLVGWQRWLNQPARQANAPAPPAQEEPVPTLPPLRAVVCALPRPAGPTVRPGPVHARPTELAIQPLPAAPRIVSVEPGE